MYYATHYSSPIGPLMLVSDENNIVGLWMEGQKYFGGALAGKPVEEDDIPVLLAAKRWLDRYFAGGTPLSPNCLWLPSAASSVRAFGACYVKFPTVK